MFKLIKSIKYSQPMFARHFSGSQTMLQKIYVGNLSWGSSEESLKTLCEPFGSIADAFIVRDRLTGKSRGFGFVEFASKDSADKAVEKLNGSQVDGRSIKVNFAEEKPPKSRF